MRGTRATPRILPAGTAGRALVAAVAVAVMALAGCGDSQPPQGPTGNEAEPTSPPEGPGGLTVTSEAFDDGDSIPTRYTCDGAEVSPPLEWSGVPDGAAELVLVVTDPDAPNGEFVHWVVGGLDPDRGGLDEGEVPDEAVEGRNGFEERGYGAPCPPSGDTAHRYVFRLYAAGEQVDMQPGASVDEVRGALEASALADGQLVGTYTR